MCTYHYGPADAVQHTIKRLDIIAERGEGNGSSNDVQSLRLQRLCDPVPAEPSAHAP